jgi:hypothetical protein
VSRYDVQPLAWTAGLAAALERLLKRDVPDLDDGEPLPIVVDVSYRARDLLTEHEFVLFAIGADDTVRSSLIAITETGAS